MMMVIQRTTLDMQGLIEDGRLRQVRDELAQWAPYDVAELLGDLTEHRRAVVFRILPRELAADVFEKLSVDEQETLLATLGQERTRVLIEEMDPDDRTALLEELPARVTRKLLRLLSPKERRIAQSLLAYPENSVGRFMTPDYIELPVGATAAQAIEHIRDVGMDKETVYVCYITRPGHVLAGVVKLRRLLVAAPETRMDELMTTPDAVAETVQDREEAAQALSDYDMLALPVLDSDRRIVGILTVDDVLDILEEEASEDMQVMAGILPETERPYLTQGLLGIGWRRGIPLLGLVAGEFSAGLVMGSFHDRLNATIALAFFIPMVMATGGSTGQQTATLIVRGLSTGEMALAQFWRILRREMLVCALLGGVLGACGLGLGYMMVHHMGLYGGDGALPWKIAWVVGGTLPMVMLLSVVVGVVLPMGLQMARLDPAIVTSPLLATVVDVLGLLIYFIVAGRILGF